MKVIALEEHYTLPAIAEANPNSPRRVFQAMSNERFDDADPQGGWQWPAGIHDLGEGRIAAMDAAGIDVQILFNVPGADAVEPPLAVELARQANEAVAAEESDRWLAFRETYGIEPFYCQPGIEGAHEAAWRAISAGFAATTWCRCPKSSLSTS